MNQVNHFLSHPDLTPYFEEILPNLVVESDRGAILLGVSQVDEHLKLLFENLIPENISGKRKKEIFSYTGPFGSLASKLDIALVCRILSSDLVNTIHKVRKIRNNLAHNSEFFKLSDYQETEWGQASLIRYF